MNNNLKIKLGEYKSVNSINKDITDKITFNGENVILNESDIRTIIDITNLFDEERQLIDTYRIHGKIEYLSILNGLNPNYKTLSDFFSLYNFTDKRSLYDDFEFYLVQPAPEFEKINNNTFIRKFKVLTSVDDIEIFNAGFSKNIFNEQQYSFTFNKDFDVKDMFDGIKLNENDNGLPITELFLYALYKPQMNGNDVSETMESYSFTENTYKTFLSVSLFPDDIIYGDLIQFNIDTFNTTILTDQTYKIRTPYDTNKALKWRYNPFIPINLRYFGDEVEKLNIMSNSVQDVSNIPVFAKELDNKGNLIWKSLMDKGFVDPLTGKGSNYPFLNKKHYVFNNIILSVAPDLSDQHTLLVFIDIKYNQSEKVTNKPLSGFDDIGKLCNL